MHTVHKNRRSPSRFGWALLLLALGTAVLLRSANLGVWPPGLYRDEAFNGLDALQVLEGNLSLFFTANNGREPLYIYLTALSVAILGRSVLAVRLAAALVGSATTWLAYRLGRAWFGRQVGLLSAWLWAITLWPVHLSRVGLRPILLPAALALAFWLGTAAYRRQQPRWWLLAGLAYGLGFYTYLAMRFTPLLLLAVGAYLLWQGRGRRLWPGPGWFLLGTAAALLPLALFLAQRPELLLGRSGQVSILNPAINGGDFWGTLWRQTGQALGLFVWRGDTILRHNPAGRPLFDWLMAGPFLLGLGWCLRHWRRPAAAVTLLWVGVMLGPTILAEDAPHFLRSVGILPVAIFLPALGLHWLWRRLPWPAVGRSVFIGALLAGSLLLTLRDYVNYSRQPETALLFEAAATALARQIQEEEANTAVYLDRWFWDEPSQKGWPSLPFLIDLSRVRLYRPESSIPPAGEGRPVALYAWPYGDLSFVPALLAGQATVVVESGRLARGDLEPEPYPLYLRYAGEERPNPVSPPVNFGNVFLLQSWAVSLVDAQTVQVDLFWQRTSAERPARVAFLHLLDEAGVVTQADAPPGGANWLPEWWQDGQLVHEKRLLRLPEPYDPGRHTVRVGLYNPATLERVPVIGANEATLGDGWMLTP